MTPRKAKSFFPEVASELDLPEEVVEAIVDFYWKEVRKELTEPTHITVTIENFGIFEIRKQQVEYLIEKYRRISKNIKPTTYQKHTLLNVLTQKLAMLEKLLELLKEQEKKKQLVRELQKNGKTV